MTVDEASQIFNVWKDWYWPCHFILNSIFMSRIPESYLPYGQDVLEEALNIVAKDYFDRGEITSSRDIQAIIGALLSYTNDDEALESASACFSNPEMVEVVKIYIGNYKRDWTGWLEKQNG